MQISQVNSLLLTFQNHNLKYKIMIYAEAVEPAVLLLLR